MCLLELFMVLFGSDLMQHSKWLDIDRFRSYQYSLVTWITFIEQNTPKLHMPVFIFCAMHGKINGTISCTWICTYTSHTRQVEKYDILVLSFCIALCIVQDDKQCSNDPILVLWLCIARNITVFLPKIWYCHFVSHELIIRLKSWICWICLCDRYNLWVGCHDGWTLIGR